MNSSRKSPDLLIYSSSETLKFKHTVNKMFHHETL
jgi:hypothetical protein